MRCVCIRAGCVRCASGEARPGTAQHRRCICPALTTTLPHLPCSYVIAHAAHYLIESLGLEMASVPKLAARARGGEGKTPACLS